MVVPTLEGAFDPEGPNRHNAVVEATLALLPECGGPSHRGRRIGRRSLSATGPVGLRALPGHPPGHACSDFVGGRGMPGIAPVEERDDALARSHGPLEGPPGGDGPRARAQRKRNMPERAFAVHAAPRREAQTPGPGLARALRGIDALSRQKTAGRPGSRFTPFGAWVASRAGRPRRFGTVPPRPGDPGEVLEPFQVWVQHDVNGHKEIQPAPGGSKASLLVSTICSTLRRHSTLSTTDPSRRRSPE